MHRGEYSIRLENNLGVDTASALVTVADKPSAPSAPSVVLLRDNSCVLEWKDGLDDGGCPVQTYIIEYFRVNNEFHLLSNAICAQSEFAYVN